MTPLYFPFTHLSPRAAPALQAHFETLALLRPFAGPLPPAMQELERGGFLKIWAPAAGEEGVPAAVLRRLQEWGERHAGGVGPAAAFWQERLGGGEPSAFDLAARIKPRSSSDTTVSGSSKADRLRAVRVFLHLAQELDRQEDELLQGLASHDRLNARLMEGLMGRPGPGASPIASPGSSPHEAHRLAERLSAWSRLFVDQDRPRPLLVTTGAAVVDHLLERCTGARRLPAGTGDGRSGALLPALAQWAEAPAERIAALPPAGEGLGTGLNQGGPIAFLFPGQAPRHFLGRFCGREQGGGAALSAPPPGENTLVVLVAPGPIAG